MTETERRSYWAEWPGGYAAAQEAEILASLEALGWIPPTRANALELVPFDALLSVAAGCGSLEQLAAACDVDVLMMRARLRALTPRERELLAGKFPDGLSYAVGGGISSGLTRRTPLRRKTPLRPRRQPIRQTLPPSRR